MGVPIGQLTGIMAMISCASALMIGFAYGFSVTFHSFDTVYDVRLDMRDKVGANGLLTRYLLSWETNVFIPCSFVAGLAARNWPVAGLMVILQLFLYSVTAMKGIIFYLPMLYLLFFVLQRINNSGISMLLAPLGITILFLGIDYMLNSELLTILFIRRQFMNPGIMLGAWFDCFYAAPKAWLGHSIFRHFVDAPYDQSPGQIVGNHIWGVPEMNACGNFLADGYANFGYFGICITTLIVGSTLHLYDRITARGELGLAICLGFIPFLMLVDGGILTCLLTHGIGVLFVVAWFLTGFHSSCAVPRKGSLL
jgi:hypothetical protein